VLLLGFLTGQFVGFFDSGDSPAQPSLGNQRVAQQEAHVQPAQTARAAATSAFFQVACDPVTLVIFATLFMLVLWCGGASGWKSGPPGWSPPTVRAAILTAGELALQVDPDGSYANERQQMREKEQQMLADVFRQNLRLHV
jgi:hypothetical protein